MRAGALRGFPTSHTSTLRKHRPRTSAALSPAGPPPTMMASYVFVIAGTGSGRRSFVSVGPALSVCIDLFDRGINLLHEFFGSRSLFENFNIRIFGGINAQLLRHTFEE